MLAPKAVLKAVTLALILTAAAGSDGRAAMADKTAQGIDSAESCLSEVSRLRGNALFAEWKLSGFMRKLANDIDYARSWAAVDDSRALDRLGDGSCSDRLARWTETNPAEPAKGRAATAMAMDDSETLATAPLSDLEYYLRSRQAAIATISRIQASARVTATSYRRPLGY